MAKLFSEFEKCIFFLMILPIFCNICSGPFSLRFLVEISLQLFNDPKLYPDSRVKSKVQARILTSFINGLKEQQLSEAELFIHELLVVI